MFALVTSAEAEVTVVDAVSTQQAAATQVSQANARANAELMYQLQMLQEEIMQMRGMLEEQQHELNVLKQQRLDDYVNLDKRISELSQQPSTSAPGSGAIKSSVPKAAPKPAIPASSPLVAKKQQDKEAFNAAYDLVKERKLDEAKEALTGFLAKYPDSPYVPNAEYWAGALYFIDGNFSKAKTHFQAIISRHPDHSKYPEALYKLAEINYEQGDRDTARAQMEELIKKYSETSVNTVRKARSFIEKHYL